jgi:hypothetical protein
MEGMISRFLKEDGARRLDLGHGVTTTVQGIGGKIVISHDTPEGSVMVALRNVEILDGEFKYDYKYLLQTGYFKQESKKDQYKSDTVIEEVLYGDHDYYDIE